MALYLVPNLKIKGLAEILVISATQIYEGDCIQELDEVIGKSRVE